MKSPAFQFYPDDFIGGTVSFSAEEVGAYIRLLSYQWGHGSIPEKQVAIDRVAGCSVSADVMAKFENGQNTRLEIVRNAQIQHSKERSESGKRGADSRWLKNGSANGSANQQPMAKRWQNDGSPSPTPSPTPSVPPYPQNGERELGLEVPPATQTKKSWNPTPLQLRLNGLFRRRETRAWSEKEMKAFKQVGSIMESDLQALEAYYSATIHESKDRRRHDLTTLLNNLNGEIDRALNFKPPVAC